MRVQSGVPGYSAVANRPSAREQQEWKGLLAEKLEGASGSMEQNYVDNIEKTVSGAMEKFLKKNPLATAEELEKEMTSVFEKSFGNELFSKIVFDDFLGYIKRMMDNARREMNAG